jgi:creatinine amidohydrolase
MRTHLLSRLTWYEVQEITQKPCLVLLPVGSLEQNGQACPLGTDAIVGDHFCQRLAKRSGALMAPPISYGQSEAFKGFPGTVSLRAGTLCRVIKDVLLGLIRAGFTHIVVVNNHGSNEPSIEEAVRELQSTADAVIGLIWPSRIMRQLLVGSGEVPVERIGHGGEPAASIISHVYPDSLRLDGAGPDRLREWGDFSILDSHQGSYEGLPFDLFIDVARHSTTGTTGDPTYASPELGAALLTQALDWATRALEAFRQLDCATPRS